MNLFNKISKWVKMKFSDESGEEKDSVIEYKILILGERLVGKSSICSRFAVNEFNLEIKPTTFTECCTKYIKLGEETIKVYLIDIDENVMKQDRSYLYADVKGALVVYDVTKSKTFEKLDNWIIDLRQNSSLNMPIVIAGNKSDLSYLKNVDYEEGLEKATNLTCEFTETSCVDSNSVIEAFKLLIAKIYYNDLSESRKNYFKIYFSSSEEGKEINKVQGEQEENNENNENINNNL
jgi:small GTP-binding protein